MTDRVSPEVRSRMMAAIKGRDTKPEMELRRLLHARGHRYRVHRKVLAWRPDIVFVTPRVAVFLDGDFWHGNAWKTAHKGVHASCDDWLATMSPYWQDKLRRNMERDRRTTRALRRDGWSVIRIWESDLKRNPEACVRKVERALDRRAAGQEGETP